MSSPIETRGEVSQEQMSMENTLALARNTIQFLRAKLGCIADGEFNSLERCEKWAKEALLTENSS